MFRLDWAHKVRGPRTLGKNRARLAVEVLESRLVPYALSGSAWLHPEYVTISFVPDGTVVGSVGGSPAYSNLFASMNARFGSPGVWEPQILLAAQAWAMQTNLNLNVVSDNGTGIGNGAFQQGDPGMGDIRISGYNFGNSVLAQTSYPGPANNYSISGDMQFNTGQSWSVSGSTYDLFSVATHEFGHAFGLDHNNTDSTAAMYPSYTGFKGMNADDVAGVRAIYSGGAARVPDRFNSNGLSNSTWQTSTDLTGYINPVSNTVLMSGLNISSLTVPEWYVVRVPSGTTSTPMILVQSKLQSMLFPQVQVYSNGYVAGSGSVGYPWNGSLLVVNLSNITAGQMLYIQVGGDTTMPFGIGNYALALNFGTGPTPSVGAPPTATLNGNPLHSGGSVSESIDSFPDLGPATPAIPVLDASAATDVGSILQVVHMTPSSASFVPVQPVLLVGPPAVTSAATTLFLPTLPASNGTVVQPAAILFEGAAPNPLTDDAPADHALPQKMPAPVTVTAEPEQAVREVPVPTNSWPQASTAAFTTASVPPDETSFLVDQGHSSLAMEAAVAAAGFVAFAGENRLHTLRHTTEERKGRLGL